MAALTYLLDWLTTREASGRDRPRRWCAGSGTTRGGLLRRPGEYELLSLSERLCRSLADKSWSGRSASWATATGWASPC